MWINQHMVKCESLISSIVGNIYGIYVSTYRKKTNTGCLVICFSTLLYGFICCFNRDNDRYQWDSNGILDSPYQPSLFFSLLLSPLFQVRWHRGEVVASQNSAALSYILYMLILFRFKNTYPRVYLRIYLINSLMSVFIVLVFLHLRKHKRTQIGKS